jgi:predicted amidohydrolase
VKAFGPFALWELAPRLTLMKNIFLLLLFTWACKPAPTSVAVEDVTQAQVKVAAIQCFSRMGAIQENRQRLTGLIREAANKGAKIVVLPEAAISGYMDPINDTTWCKTLPGEDELAVQKVAESKSGESVKYFCALAKELKIYLTIPFIESAGQNFYNTVILTDPAGGIIAHHRKQDLWKHGDSSWCTEGDLEAQVVDSPYGRLGLMICYDVHSMPLKLAEKKADVVLYSVGWYGPNTEDWYRNRFPRKVLIPNHFSVVSANWAQEAGQEVWPGCGWSHVTYKNGVVLKMSTKQTGSSIVYADLFIDR